MINDQICNPLDANNALIMSLYSWNRNFNTKILFIFANITTCLYSMNKVNISDVNPSHNCFNFCINQGNWKELTVY